MHSSRSQLTKIFGAVILSEATCSLIASGAVEGSQYFAGAPPPPKSTACHPERPGCPIHRSLIAMCGTIAPPRWVPHLRHQPGASYITQLHRGMCGIFRRVAANRSRPSPSTSDKYKKLVILSVATRSLIASGAVEGPASLPTSSAPPAEESRRSERHPYRPGFRNPDALTSRTHPRAVLDFTRTYPEAVQDVSMRSPALTECLDILWRTFPPNSLQLNKKANLSGHGSNPITLCK